MTMSGIARIASILLALVAVLMAWPLPAGATVIQRVAYESPSVADYELCGIAVHEEGVFAGTVHLRVGKGSAESAFFAHDHFAYAFTVTNPENGRYFTTEGKSVFNELTATRVGETTFQFTSVEAGQTFTMREPSGSVVLRDRGRIRSTILFDTLGDDSPGGELLAWLDDDVAGPHPGYLFDDEGRFCPAVQELLA
jgi:hypothetical protein